MPEQKHFLGDWLSLLRLCSVSKTFPTHCWLRSWVLSLEKERARFWQSIAHTSLTVPKQETTFWLSTKVFNIICFSETTFSQKNLKFLWSKSSSKKKNQLQVFGGEWDVCQNVMKLSISQDLVGTYRKMNDLNLSWSCGLSNIHLNCHPISMSYKRALMFVFLKKYSILVLSGGIWVVSLERISGFVTVGSCRSLSKLLNISELQFPFL